MQEFISFFKYLATSNTINFIIMVAILAIIVKKMNLNSVFDSSISKVDASIKKSDEEKEKSEKLLTGAQKLIEKLPQDIETLEKEAVSKAEVFKAQIEASTQKTIFGIHQNVDRAIAIEEKKISNLMTGKTIKASVELAKSNIEELLAKNPELHGKFIEESLDELDKVNL